MITITAHILRSSEIFWDSVKTALLRSYRLFAHCFAGYLYTESDDFGNGRSYGFARKHLGHDMFCSVGTPVAAVENGVVEAMGWNQYGGWRIGIRSLDRRRYYYYAHLRKDAPFAKGLKEGAESAQVKS